MTTHIISAPRALVGPNLDLLEHASVVVKGRIIEWVGPTSELPERFADAERIDFEQGTITPGLIDSHVHLGSDGGPEPFARLRSESDEQQVALQLRSARELLSVGVTTARDLGERNYTDIVTRDAIAGGTARGPRILAAGTPLTPTAGHCWFMNGEADGELEVRKRIREHQKAGVDCFKIMSTGGFMTEGSAPWNAQFTTEELRAAVEEAHRFGKKISAHAHSVRGIKRSLDAGVDFLEHCSFIDDEGNQQWDPDLAQRIIASGTVVSPTINWAYAYYMVDKPLETWTHYRLAQAGARIVASTDAGIDNVPHWAFVEALEVMQEATGWDAKRVLLAATSDPADALGIAHLTGALDVGREADILVAPGNPDEDLSALRGLLHIEARGERFIPDPHGPLPAAPDMTRFHAKPHNH